MSEQMGRGERRDLDGRNPVSPLSNENVALFEARIGSERDRLKVATAGVIADRIDQFLSDPKGSQLCDRMVAQVVDALSETFFAKENYEEGVSEKELTEAKEGSKEHLKKVFSSPEHRREICLDCAKEVLPPPRERFEALGRIDQLLTHSEIGAEAVSAFRALHTEMKSKANGQQKFLALLTAQPEVDSEGLPKAIDRAARILWKTPENFQREFVEQTSKEQARFAEFVKVLETGVGAQIASRLPHLLGIQVVCKPENFKCMAEIVSVGLFAEP